MKSVRVDPGAKDDGRVELAVFRFSLVVGAVLWTIAIALALGACTSSGGTIPFKLDSEKAARQVGAAVVTYCATVPLEARLYMRARVNQHTEGNTVSVKCASDPNLTEEAPWPVQ